MFFSRPFFYALFTCELVQKASGVIMRLDGGELKNLAKKNSLGCYQSAPYTTYTCHGTLRSKGKRVFQSRNPKVFSRHSYTSSRERYTPSKPYRRPVNPTWLFWLRNRVPAVSHVFCYQTPSLHNARLLVYPSGSSWAPVAIFPNSPGPEPKNSTDHYGPEKRPTLRAY